MGDNPENTEKKGQKRKKKRSSAQMLKKFAHSRSQGQGCQIELECYRHMVHIMEVIRTEFPQMEDKESFADNIIRDTKGFEADCAKNQVASCVLEALIPYASFDTVEKLMEAFSPHLRSMCSDGFASHVLQKSIIACSKRCLIQKSDQEDKSVGSKDKKFGNIALKLIKYVLNNLEDFIWDFYANYIARTCIECLGGLLEMPVQGKKAKPDFEKREKMPEEFLELLTKKCLHIQTWPQFHDFGQDVYTSGFLQSVLYSLKDVDSEICSSMINTIIQKCFTKNGESDLSNAFNSESSVRLLEVCLMVGEEEEFAEIHRKFFVKKLKELSLTKSTNFAVQKLLDFCPNKEQFEDIYGEIESSSEEILQTGHTGVLSSLANACLRLHAKQGPFLNVLYKILHCSEPEERQSMFITLCIGLRTFEQHQRMEKDKLSLHLHGSLIIQALLNFNKPIKVVSSMLEMDTEELISIFGDPKGSRILDAFMDSKFVGSKSREKMARKLKGHWAELAACIHGSRCLDKVWEKSEMKDKTSIMNELASAGQSLMSTKAGKLIYNKFKVNVYCRNKNEWAQVIGKEEKTKSLFADIIN